MQALYFLPIVDTVFSLQNARFKYPRKSAPTHEMHTVNSLNLTKEEVDINEKVVGKSVIFPESIRQDTYRVPKTLLDQAIKDVNMTKSQAETLKQDINNLPDFIDFHD